MKMEKEKAYSKRNICCGFCDEMFTAEYTIGSQVRCPKCNNFVPSHKKELTNNLTGRKHIHSDKNDWN